MTAARARFAVIGTGAAALGVLDALLARAGDAAITVFDIGDVPAPDPEPDTDAAAFYQALYADLRASGLRGFPPPKTHFGDRLPVHPGGHGLIQSRSLGGLTNYWGATMLPFTEVELRTWPIPFKALAPHYARIAELAGIAGSKDALDGYFGAKYVNRPAISVTPVLGRLSARIGARNGGRYQILAGANRCAIETRVQATHACTGCGECLAGCYRGAIYSARHSLTAMLKDQRVKVINARVIRVDPHMGSIQIELAGEKPVINGFDRIFLAAGCLGSTEILMRSTGLVRANPVRTNSVHVFPILNFGRGDGAVRAHVSLANLILACVPDGHDAPMAQAQVYPNPDYLWRPQMPAALWQLVRGAVAASRARLFWGRLFVHSDQSQSYLAGLRNDALILDEGQAPDRAEPAQVLKSLKQAVTSGGLRVLTHPTILQKASVHYGSTFGYGNTILPIPATGEALPRIHICDSTVFPEMPAVSPTFTIMANARRTAMEALDA